MIDGALLFFIFLKDAALSLGGLGALPLVRQDLVDPGIVSEADVVQALAIGRLSTGPTGLWIVSLGYFAAGWAGATAALLASCLPPLVMLPATRAARRYLLTPWFGGFVRGAALATAGLLVSTGVALVAPDGVMASRVAWWQVLVAAAALVVVYDGRAHPGAVVVGGALAGLVLAR